MNLTPIHLGKAIGGHFVPDNPEHVKFDLEGLEGLDIAVKVNPIRRTRSLELNAFFWSRVIRPIVNYCNENKTFGRHIDGEFFHELMKYKFLGTEKILIPGSEVIEKVKSSRKLTNAEFVEYCDYVMAFANEMFGLALDWPEPKEEKEVAA